MKRPDHELRLEYQRLPSRLARVAVSRQMWHVLGGSHGADDSEPLTRLMIDFPQKLTYGLTYQSTNVLRSSISTDDLQLIASGFY